MEAGREFQQTKSREILLQFIDTVGELSMLWMHRHTATTKSGQEGRRLLHQHDYRIFDFHLSESSTQQCFNDEMHVVFASAITNFVIFL